MSRTNTRCVHSNARRLRLSQDDLMTEIVSLEIKGRKGETTNFARDEHARAGTTKQDLGKLAPVFSKDGTVTAGNSSGITDGAAAVVVLSEAALERIGCPG